MATRKQIVNRLKRARGQLDGLIDQLERDDVNCRDVLTQFAALKSAISRASYLTVATIMSQCIIDDEEDSSTPSPASTTTSSNVTLKPEQLAAPGHITLAELEKLFLSLT